MTWRIRRVVRQPGRLPVQRDVNACCWQTSAFVRRLALFRVVGYCKPFALARVRWTGDAALFTALAGYDVRADVLKSKHSSPGKSASVHADCLRLRSVV